MSTPELPEPGETLSQVAAPARYRALELARTVVLTALETIAEHISLLVLLGMLALIDYARRQFSLSAIPSMVFVIAEVMTGLYTLQQFVVKMGGWHGIKRAWLGRPDQDEGLRD